MSSLFSDGVLLDVKVKSWSFQTSLKAKDLKIKKEDVPEIFSLGRKALFRREVISQFASIRTLVDYYTQKYSFAFPVGGVRYVPYKSLPIVLEHLKQLKQEFTEAVDGFVGKYDEERKAMLLKWKKYAEALVDAYPEPTAIADRFAFDWVIFEIGAAKPMTDKKLQKEMKEHEIFISEIAEYQNKLRNRIDSFLNDAVLSLREEAAKVCKKIVDKIDNQEVVSEKSVNALRDLIDRFSLINFVDDKNLEDTLNDLRAKITTGKDIASSQKLQDIIKEGANKVITMAENVSDMTSTVASYKSRRIDFKPKEEGVLV